MSEQCSAYAGNYAGSCFNKAKVERSGKWYCGVHDPVRQAEKQAERDRLHQLELAQSKADQTEGYAILIRELRALDLNDTEAVIAWLESATYVGRIELIGKRARETRETPA